MPVVHANGIDINYEVQGEGEPMVLIPYLAADQACYAFQVAEYAKHFTWAASARSVTAQGQSATRLYWTPGGDGVFRAWVAADREIALPPVVGPGVSKHQREREQTVGNPVVHFEIRSTDPDATREFYGKLFGWTFPDGGMPGYSYVDTGIEGAVPGGISPLQGGGPLVTFFVGVQDVAATLDAAVAQGGRVIQPATSVPGVTFGLLADPHGQVVGLAAADA